MIFGEVFWIIKFAKMHGCQFGVPKAKISIADKSIMMEDIYDLKWKSKLSKMPKDTAVCLTASLKS